MFDKELRSWEREHTLVKSRELKKNIKRSQGERRTREQVGKEESKPPKRRRYKILEEDWGFQVGATRSLPKVGEEELPLGALIKSHQPTMDGWVILRGCREKPPLLADISNKNGRARYWRRY